MNNRSANVDLARFLAALIILIYHVDACGIEVSKGMWRDGFYYVEFFFLVTGYYTARHFENKNHNNTIKSAIEYTIKKFIPILPYTIVITIIHWIAFGLILLSENTYRLKDFVFSFFTDFIFDIILLTAAWKKPLVGSLWFVSSMMIVFPLLCILVQLNNRYLVLLVSFISWLIPFACGYGETCEMLIHAFSGLCLGVVSYEISYIFYDVLNKVNKKMLTAIEIIFFVLPIVLTFKDIKVFKFVVFCFFVFSTIMLSGCSYTSMIKGKAFNFLGKLSLPIYIVQLTVGEIIAKIFGAYSEFVRQFIYYSATFMVAIILLLLFENSKSFKKVRNIKIDLKE